jgi:hypothetical protein
LKNRGVASGIVILVALIRSTWGRVSRHQSSVSIQGDTEVLKDLAFPVPSGGAGP